ncbi:MAG: S41 family peptidase [Proteobacteria bacterium]|nr:S41 family peptidase [Pseudomonadota bacterium]
MQRLLSNLIKLSFSLGCFWGGAVSALPASASLVLFDEAVAQLTPPKPAAEGWQKKVTAVRRDLGDHPSDAQVRLALNQLFHEAAAGGDAARLYSSADQKFWSNSACFGAVDGAGGAGGAGGDHAAAARLRHIGAWFERHGNRWFVRTVLSGGPAADAGLLRGDEIVDVNGAALQPVGSFSSLGSGQKAVVRYRRLPWEEPRRVLVATTEGSLAEAMVSHLLSGKYWRQVDGKRVLYVPLLLSCRPSLASTLMALAKAAQIKGEAMVLDLRGDYTDGGLTYLDPFLSLPTSADTVATPLSVAPYAKALVVLVDQGTGGGREKLAAFLQKHRRAKIVGQPTAGATRPGRAIALTAGTEAPTEAVHDIIWVPSTGEASAQILPDILSEASLVYAAGSDPQLDQAFSAAANANRP